MKINNLTLQILLFTSFVFILTSCSVTFKTANIKQPLLLSSRVGMNGIELPSDTKSKGEVSGEVVFERTLRGSSYGSEIEQATNADVNFLPCVGTDANRCVTNLYFRIANYQYWMFSGNKSLIEFYGDCKTIPQSSK